METGSTGFIVERLSESIKLGFLIIRGASRFFLVFVEIVRGPWKGGDSFQ
ncbi:hypothetical protein ES703_50333 [subsurface metagenome]